MEASTVTNAARAKSHQTVACACKARILLDSLPHPAQPPAFV